MKHSYINYRSLLITIAVFCLTILPLQAQTKTDSHIHGHVLDAKTGEHLP